MPTKPIAIAIDGPSGAGKSTLARRLAEELGFTYVDTGALYRAVGVAALARGVHPGDEAGVAALLPSLSAQIRHVEGEQRVFICGEDVTGEIRTPAASMAASAVSAHPCVRAFLFDTQRQMARAGNVVMDGRDIGTVVLPDAPVKLFLTASPEERARRRLDELTDRDVEATFEQVLADMIKRDRDDSTRAVAPLRPAPDALRLDTTGNTLEQSAKLLRETVAERLAQLSRGEETP